MKKIIAFMICIVLMCAMPIAVFAEETDVLESSPVIEETLPETEEAIPEETVPEVDESVPAPDTTVPEPDNTTPEEPTTTFTDEIAAWFENNYDWLSIVIAIFVNIIYMGRKLFSPLNKNIGILNNNSIAVAEKGSKAATEAAEALKGATEVINGYGEKMALLLDKIEKNEDEKQKLQDALNNTTNYLKTAKLANKALSDEVAKLLTLANIPVSVKDELYAQHLEAVRAIAEAETTEVKEDVNEA